MNISHFILHMRVHGGTALQTGKLQVQFPMVSLEIFIDIIHPAALWPWGRLSLEYQEYFLQVKVAGVRG